MPIPLWLLTGPTASGKSNIALHIAEKTHGEIVSIDSMLVYRGMDIGTEKPPREIRSQFRHHLIDIVDPWEEYNVGKYVNDFETVTKKLFQQGKAWIVTGGTALYIKAIVEGLFEGPPADNEYRNHLKTLAKEQGPEYLHKMLAEVDKETARKFHFHDKKRIIRALEVYKLTGEKISSFQTQFGRKNPQYNTKLIGIQYDRNILYQRIEDRVDRMIKNGLVEEVQCLVNNPKGLSKQASQALGYKEIIDYLHGTYTLRESIDMIKLRTRRFAKHQLTWFRSFPDMCWIQANPDDTTEKLSKEVLEFFKQGY